MKASILIYPHYFNNMATSPGSILQFKTFDNKNKSYIVKLSSAILFGSISGIVGGIIYTPDSGSALIALIGFSLFFLQSIGISFLVNYIYKLSPWTPIRIWRHAILSAFFLFFFFWILLFNFIVIPKIPI